MSLKYQAHRSWPTNLHILSLKKRRHDLNICVVYLNAKVKYDPPIYFFRAQTLPNFTAPIILHTKEIHVKQTTMKSHQVTITIITTKKQMRNLALSQLESLWFWLTCLGMSSLKIWTLKNLGKNRPSWDQPLRTCTPIFPDGKSRLCLNLTNHRATLRLWSNLT